MNQAEQIAAGHAETRRLIAEQEGAAEFAQAMKRQRRRDHARKWTWLYVILFGLGSLVIGSCHSITPPGRF
jgi:hypothetical protein